MSASARALLAPEAAIARDAPLAPGSGMLRFARVAGRTVLTRAIAASPLKLLNPGNAGTAAWVYLATYGGGLVGGDALRLTIDVGPGRRGAGRDTSVDESVPIGSRREPAIATRASTDDSLLVLLPDPVTAFAGSRYTQEQHVRAADAARTSCSSTG